MAARLETQAEPIPGYTLVERLGGGGFGEVWKAVAPGGILKAIKFVYGDLDTISDEGQRAKQELKALSRVKTVRHPYILSLERFDIVDGQLMIVMELADRNLWDRFRECQGQGLPGIPRGELLGYMQEAAEALDLMNIQYQLQHIDIKPQNLFLVHNHVKVADFGLVKDLEGRMASVTGGVTPVYAAPETFDGWISRFCDQYSLAIVYQELLTGRRPFTGTSLRQLILQHLQASPNLSSLPVADREAVGRALAKSPDDRFPTCLDLVRVLQAATTSSRTAPAKSVEETHQETGLAQDTPEYPLRPERRAPAFQEAADDASPSGASDVDLETHWINVRDIPDRLQDDLSRTRRVPEDIHGDGVLFPALVIGLGDLGLGVLQRLRKKMHGQVGPIDRVPNIKLLYLDTDPESLRYAGKGDAASALTPHEVLVAKLNRPSHYLRSNDERKRIDTWFDLQMLYRIPRALVTTGLRALGRLAFFDNYRLVNRRLSNELESCTFPENLTAAAENTGLGFRSNRPKVYVVTGLAGGTGSGIFLDLTYLVRRLLRNLGYDQPEIIGIFLLPAVDRHPSRTLALGNTFAALTELNHFSAPANTYTASFSQREPLLVDAEAPFTRCVVLPLPEPSDEPSTNQRQSMVAEYLCRELLTPLGRVADERRADVRNYSTASRTLLCQTLGLRRIAWPRAALVRRAARRVCHEVVQRWMSKDANSVREAVRQSVAALWQERKLGGEELIARFEKSCADALAESPEAAFARLTSPLASLDPQKLDDCVSALREACAQIDRTLGKPQESLGGSNGEINEPLSVAAEQTTSTWGKLLSQFAVDLIEQPEYRLAGAEEAIRQMIVTVEQVLQHYEPLSKELASRTSDAIDKVNSGLTAIKNTAPTGRKLASMVTAVAELVQVYPKWRLQSLILQRVVGVYISLRGYLSDQLRELNFCRGRLEELKRTLDCPEPESFLEEELGTQRMLLPGKSRSLKEATGALIADMTKEKFHEVDREMQTLMREQFSALSHVCLSSANLIPNVREAMQKVAEQFVAQWLANVRLTDLFFERYTTDDQTRAELTALVDEAAPDLASARLESKRETCVFGVPEDKEGAKLTEILKKISTDVDVTVVDGKDDIFLYRELQEIGLSQLQQLGPLAYEAYRQMAGLEHFTPHSRIDIHEWQAASA